MKEAPNYSGFNLRGFNPSFAGCQREAANQDIAIPRFYGPLKPWFDKKWKPGGLEPVH